MLTQEESMCKDFRIGISAAAPAQCGRRHTGRMIGLTHRRARNVPGELLTFVPPQRGENPVACCS